MFLETFKSRIIAMTLAMTTLSVAFFGYGLAGIYYAHMQKCVSRSLGFLANIIEHEYDLDSYSSDLNAQILQNYQIKKVLTGGLIDDFRVEHSSSITITDDRIYHAIALDGANELLVSSSKDKIDSELRDMVIEKWLYFLSGFIIAASLIVLLIRYLFVPFNTLVNHCLTCQDPDTKPKAVSGGIELQALRNAIIALQQRISKLQKIQHETMKALTHELKTPLAQMRLRLDLADQKGEWNRDSIVQSRDEIDSISSKITEILYQSNTNIEMININIYNKLQLWLDELKSLQEHKNLEISTNITQDMTILIKKEPFERVFRTLLENSINHSKNGSKIYINYTNRVFEITNSIGSSDEKIILSSKNGLKIAKTICEHYGWRLSHISSKDEYIATLELKKAPQS